MDTTKKLEVVRIQGFKDAFKVEFDFTDFSIEDAIDFILTLNSAGFKGTTFERKAEKADIIGKIGKIESVEQTKTKTNKDAYIAHIVLEDMGDGDDAKTSIMFFAKGAARKGDKVKIKKNDAGFTSFDIVDPETGEITPF